MAELQTEINCMERASRIEEMLEEGEAGSDSTWFVRHLTERQRKYGIYIVQTGGDWKKAAIRAGYAPSVSRTDIEFGDVMTAYMRALIAELSAVDAISATTILARMNRIALKAEEGGDLPTAVRANTKIGEQLGMFVQRTLNVNVNADGKQIVIGGTRNDDDDALYLDAEFEELATLNGLSLPARGEDE